MRSVLTLQQLGQILRPVLKEVKSQTKDLPIRATRISLRKYYLLCIAFLHCPVIINNKNNNTCNILVAKKRTP